MDDFALFEHTENRLLRVLERFIKLSADINFFIYLPKSTFFAKEIRWCGRRIDDSGVMRDSANYAGIYEPAEPVTDGKLSQYVHCVAWMRSAIPRFSERAVLLYELHEAAYKKARRRTKRAINKRNLRDLGWNEILLTIFSSFQEQIRNVVKTAYRDPALCICVHSDTSETYWAAAVM